MDVIGLVMGSIPSETVGVVATATEQVRLLPHPRNK